MGEVFHPNPWCKNSNIQSPLILGYTPLNDLIKVRDCKSLLSASYLYPLGRIAGMMCGVILCPWMLPISSKVGHGSLIGRLCMMAA